MSALSEAITLGSIRLKNRLVMAPLTRCRASGDDGRTPNDLMLQYYTQRASAGLILTEATAVTPMGVGYPNTPGIWSHNHAMAWKKITDAVHALGGKMALQLWHVGRVSDPMYLNGALPVSSSAIAPDGHVSLVRPMKNYVTPRALATNEILEVIESYRVGAMFAKQAGFDGVEIHGANGYLLEQFLYDGVNKRTDRYGGSLENRARLMLEVADAVCQVWGSDKVGMHLSPRGESHSMTDSNLTKTFSYVAEELGRRKLAFLCAREYQGADSIGPRLKKIFGGAFIANEKFTLESAEAAVQKGDADAVAFGALYIANPDLVKRYESKAKLNPPVPQTYYAKGETGYTDYPFLQG